MPRMRAPTIPISSTLFLLAAAAACAGAPALDGPGAPRASRVPSIRALLEVRAPQNPVLGRDGALYVRDWVGGVNQVFRVDRAASTGASRDRARVALTAFED